MKQAIRTVVVGIVIASLVGCAAHTHVVGHGSPEQDSAADGNKIEKRQWYILWGLVPLNEVNSDGLMNKRS